MKRSVLLSALVLALVAASACGGAPGVPGAPDAPGDSGSDDPVVEMKNIADGIQKEIDSIFEPIKTADAVIDGVAKLPAELKTMVKGKFDPKKLMAEAKKIVDGAEYNLDALGLEGEAKAKVGERFDTREANVAAAVFQRACTAVSNVASSTSRSGIAGCQGGASPSSAHAQFKSRWYRLALGSARNSKRSVRATGVALGVAAINVVRRSHMAATRGKPRAHAVPGAGDARSLTPCQRGLTRFADSSRVLCPPACRHCSAGCRRCPSWRC